MPTLKDVAVIPEQNRDQFRKYLQMLSASEPGVSITFSVELFRNGHRRFDYTAICDTQEIAVKIQQKIRDGELAHGG
jgi:hypothetical protein